MSRVKRLAAILVGTALLGSAFAGLVLAETPSPSALTGKVTSQAEGAMEGVIIGAKKVDSTITTWVVSNAAGVSGRRVRARSVTPGPSTRTLAPASSSRITASTVSGNQTGNGDGGGSAVASLGSASCGGC